jgi:hypothetical protein
MNANGWRVEALGTAGRTMSAPIRNVGISNRNSQKILQILKHSADPMSFPPKLSQTKSDNSATGFSQKKNGVGSPIPHQARLRPRGAVLADCYKLAFFSILLIGVGKDIQFCNLWFECRLVRNANNKNH